MKALYTFLFAAVVLHSAPVHGERIADDLSFEVRAQEDKQPTKMQLLIGVIGSDPALQTVAELLSQDFSCSGQKKTGFGVSVRSFAKKLSKNKIYDIFINEGYSLIVFLSAAGSNSFEWRLYDALQVSMLKGSRVTYANAKMDASVHACDDVIWKELTGQEGIFSTVIADCKELKHGKQQVRHVYTMHPAAKNSTCLVGTASNKLALRWNTSSYEPMLFYSEHTPVNVRLVSIPFLKSHEESALKLVSNFNGLNMQPSFSSDGKRTVMCASCLGSSQLYYGTLEDQEKKWKFQRITYNKGNNIAPILRDTGDIIFCSDFEFHRPHIYYYHADNRSIERLTSGSYSASPAWCEQKEMLAYVKNIKGVMQLFVYDRKKKEHTQLTTDATHKEEPTWSPEGTYLAYSVGNGNTNRIAARNLITDEEFYLTGSKEHCCYPAWSPRITV